MFSPDPRIQAFRSRVESPEAWHRAELRALRGRPVGLRQAAMTTWLAALAVAAGSLALRALAGPGRRWPARPRAAVSLPVVMMAGLVAYAAAAGLVR